MSEENEAKSPPILTYVVVGGFLGLLTVMEIATSYIHALHSVVVPVLLVLSGAKFALVVMFYMHLKYDSWAFTMVFLLLLLFALVVTGALLVLMAVFSGTL